MKPVHSVIVVTLVVITVIAAICICIFVFWPGLNCYNNLNDPEYISSASKAEKDNFPWFENYLEFYAPRNSTTLTLLHVIARHGDRTNIKECQYPQDPYLNETYAPFGYGELTNLGKRRMYELGRALRYQYDDFLGDYHPDNLNAISSGYRRSAASLQLLLAGLYPPSKEFIWMKDVNWQPVQFHINSGKDNLLGNPRMHCINWKKYFDESMESFDEIMTNYSNYFDRMQNLTGWDRNLLSVNKLYHSIITNLEWGHALDERLKTFWPEPTITLNRIFWKSWAHTDLLKQANAGMLIKTILEDSIQKIQDLNNNKLLSTSNNKKPNRKLHIYGCSDYNIISLLRLFGQEIYDNPPYGAYIIIELHKLQETFYLQFFYRPHIDAPMIPLEIPDCKTSSQEKPEEKDKTMCIFDKFLESRLKYFLRDGVC